MGAAFSKLWGAVRSVWAGGATSGEDNNTVLNGTSQSKNTKSSTLTTNTATNMGIKKYKVTEPWIRLNCSLGEAPFWEEKTNTVRFVDVEKQELHSVDLNQGPDSHKVVKKMDISIGCTADIEGNDTEFIFGGKYGYGICNRQTGDYRWIKKVWSNEEIADGKPDRMRGNDGAVDSQGRFWVGFMNDPMVKDPVDEGAVFRLDPDGSLHRILEQITIPNGTTWNKSDNTMFFADSPSRTISQFDYNPADGSITNRRPFFKMPDTTYGKDAVPDGHCIDEEGYMWTAVHGGSVVLRISPQGEIVGEIELPTQQPTCPCFVGEELFITSAGGTSGPDGKGVDEFAGSVFKVNVGVRGLKRFSYKGGANIEGGKKDGQVVGE